MAICRANKYITKGLYRAAKLCTGALHFTSQTKLEQELSWESISHRADFLALTAFHKISTHQVRPLIIKCMPCLKPQNLGTRSQDIYYPFKYHGQIFAKSFFPHITSLYNKLESDIRNEYEVNNFEKKT